MAKNFLRVLSSNGIVALIGLISSLMLPGILSIEDYAKYQTFYLYLSYITVLPLGFPSGMVIKYAGCRRQEMPRGQYRSEIALLLLILSGFTVIGLALCALTRSVMLLCITGMIVPYCYLSSYTALFQAWQEFRRYAILHVILSAVPLALPLGIYFAAKTASAEICILCYIGTYALLCAICLYRHFHFVAGVRSAPLFSAENWNTEKLGFFFLLGNYINSLFHSADKQFIKWFCPTAVFSFYSFAVTMQGVMTIFITAISLPLFPYMASRELEAAAYKKIKRILLMLGSVSGIAYFACFTVVQNYLPKYMQSLEIIRVYFAVFPAMAVINCLYFNLYKIRKQSRRYTLDLILMFSFAVIGNMIGVRYGGYIGVALATTLIYYLWLFYGTFVFPELMLAPREIAFLAGFLMLFFFIPLVKSNLWGCILYAVSDAALCVACFPRELKSTIWPLLPKRVGRR